MIKQKYYFRFYPVSTYSEDCSALEQNARAQKSAARAQAVLKGVFRAQTPQKAVLLLLRTARRRSISAAAKKAPLFLFSRLFPAHFLNIGGKLCAGKCRNLCVALFLFKAQHRSGCVLGVGGKGNFPRPNVSSRGGGKKSSAFFISPLFPGAFFQCRRKALRRKVPQSLRRSFSL